MTPEQSNLPSQPFEKRTLQIVLYSGVALIIVSVLFFLRGITDTSLGGQVLPVLIAPAIFYGIGILVYRTLNAPLAAPGIVATGAWLIGVALVHLYDRVLFSVGAQSPVWLISSLVAAALVTITGHRIKIWMIVPLVPLVQINALEAVLTILGVPMLASPALSLLLVLVWWEIPASKDRWQAIYRVSGLSFGAAMLAFSVLIPFATPQSMLVTWGIAAGCAAILGLRHRLGYFAPLTILLLAGTILLGLSAALWPFLLLVLSLVAIFAVEGNLPFTEDKATHLWLEISLALGLVLLGLAALIAKFEAMKNLNLVPFAPAWIFVVTGAVLIWFGVRREKGIAIHAGLWLLVPAWIDLYFSISPTAESYGLWLSLFAACTLLVQRLVSAQRKDKQKSPRTMVETMLRWPGADLALGLSTIALCWTAANITLYTPWILTLTFAIVIGVWLLTGLIYRIPILLHLALWISPMPLAMLLMYLSPLFYTLPMIGVAWQFYGIVLLAIGHTTRYRPVMRLPFFLTGYALLIFGFTTAINNTLLLPASLTILIMVSLATSLAVIFGYHPMWTLAVARLVPPETHPYAYRHIKHTFLFLSAWLAVIWLQIVLNYTQLTWSQQGFVLVIFSGLWFLLGMVIGRFPGLVGLPFHSAGWLLWLIGLSQVFFSPTEAMLTVILGLVASIEALRRTRALMWLPLLLLQILFTVLQGAWLLHLSAPDMLCVTAFGFGIFGLLYQSRAPRGGQLTALLGASLMLGLWRFYPALNVPLGLCALSVLATVSYRESGWFWLIQASGALLIYQFRWSVNPLQLLAISVIQLCVGAQAAFEIRPKQYQRLNNFIFAPHDWATPLLAVGGLGSLVAFVVLPSQIPGTTYLVIALTLAGIVAYYSVRLRLIHLPYLALMLIGLGSFVMLIMPSTSLNTPRINYNMPPQEMVTTIPFVNLLLISAALVLRTFCLGVVSRDLPVPRWAKVFMVIWLRPLLLLSMALGLGSLAFWTLFVLRQPATSPLLVVGGIALILFLWSIYLKQPMQLLWLCTALGVGGITWVILLNLLKIQGIHWLLLPFGLVPLVIAKEVRHHRAYLLEYSGAVLWTVGAMVSIDRGNMFSMNSIGFFFYALLLLSYGMLVAHKVPLLNGAVIAGIGLVACLGKLNIWFIPMACGALLIGGTLLLETRGTLVRGWMDRMQNFWQRLE